MPLPQRRTIRLPGYDYSTPGAYFITACTARRHALLATISASESKLNRFGCCVDQSWQELPDFYSNVQLDEMVIMPNHMHGIIIITPTSSLQKTTLSRVVRTLKSRSARRINHICGVREVPVWQRGYYERIIRDERSMRNIREYIRSNPLRWWLRRNDSSNGRVGDPR